MIRTTFYKMSLDYAITQLFYESSNCRSNHCCDEEQQPTLDVHSFAREGKHKKTTTVENFEKVLNKYRIVVKGLILWSYFFSSLLDFRPKRELDLDRVEVALKVIIETR